jgi:HAD domain in Swiss Army Knife RNA repair proteins
MRARPFLFLDVDGVRVTYASMACGHGVMDDACVKNLRRILHEANPEVVISSTWRFHPQFCKKVWKVVGKVGKATPRLNTGIRGREIEAFLLDYPGRNFVIVDDDSDMLPEQLPFFVKTRFATGLDREATEKILNLFKGF